MPTDDSRPTEHDASPSVTPATPASKVVLTADALRVLAHPLRSRLLSELRREGPATATTLAAVLGTNTGATSYHLRKLASVGLVEEVAGGHGRERRWQPAHEMHSWFASDVAGDPDAEAASEWLQGEGLRRFEDYADAWQRTQRDWPVAWRDEAGSSDYLLELSLEQLHAMQAELSAILERYLHAVPGPDPRRVFFYLHAFPQPPGRTR